jgi:hypothetical protein
MVTPLSAPVASYIQPRQRALNLRQQGESLIERFRPVYVFGKWSSNRLLGDLTLISCKVRLLFDAALEHAIAEGAKWRSASLT